MAETVSPPAKTKSNTLKPSWSFSKPQLIIFAVIFAAIGGYVLYRSFAASAPIASVEGENMIAQSTSATPAVAAVATPSATGGPVSTIPAATTKPGIPTGLKAAPGNGNVALTWNANPATDQVNTYQVYYSTSSSFSSLTYIPSVTSTTYTVSGLTNGKTYYFRISAHNTVGYGPWNTPPVSAVPAKTTTTPPPSPTAKPAIPVSLTATAANGSVVLNWSANPASDQVNNYQVYIGTNSGFSTFTTFVNNITSTTYTASGLTNGTTYYFRVSAHNSVGYGPWSASSASATPSSSSTTTPPSSVSQVVADAAASNGKEMEVLSNAALSGSFNLSSSVTSLSVVAKATICSSTGAAMVVSVDGTQVLSTTVSSTSLTSYTANVNLAAGNHTLNIAYTNDTTTSACDRNLFVDVTNFYGPAPVTTPAPTVTLSATPPSITAGSSSTLTWSSTNATSCSASGAWSGTENTSGSTTTGALNLSSTYTLTCTGAGGSANKSATVTVTAASSSSSSSGGGVSSSGVTPPQAPSAYSLPSNAVTVSSTSALSSALSGSTTDIIITNGSYTNSSYLSIGNHHLWAQSVGGVNFNFGLSMGGNSSGSDPEVHGINFNVASTSLGLNSDILNIWGSGTGAVVDDSTFNGNNVMNAGIATTVTSGFTVHRVVVNNFQSYGIYFMTTYPGYLTDAPAVEPVVTDANISNVTRSPAGASNGTAEAGLWAGTDCLCSNIKVRGAGWMGIWTGANANNGVYSNIDVDQSGSDSVGIYLEHFSRNNVFKNFIIGGSTGGSGIRVGFVCEWADPAYSGDNPVAGQSISACHGNTFQNGTIYSNFDGFTLEDAQNTTISNVTFFDQSRSAIDDFMTAGSGQTTTWQNQGNVFTGIKSGAVQYSTAH